jgi:hypothetical protein
MRSLSMVIASGQSRGYKELSDFRVSQLMKWEDQRGLWSWRPHYLSKVHRGFKAEYSNSWLRMNAGFFTIELDGVAMEGVQM